ncbi:MAG: hypothetical protein JW927_07785 [Deltaproteobacteria bacterium]|nr:hypothetical protein [Deltaproteobacteria bacterium]
MITLRTLFIVLCLAMMLVVIPDYTAAEPPSKIDTDIEKAFPGLKSVEASNAGVTIYYAPSLTEVLSGEAATTKIWDGEETADRPIRTQLLGDGNCYFIVQCDSGASADPNCQFLQELPTGGTRRLSD